MICHRDQTFCTAYQATCANHGCPRALSAAEWKGATLPISWADFSRDCPDKIETKADQLGAVIDPAYQEEEA
ncbi:hypothetical protein GN330_22800 [Nitratireductor sp. CAU 1489]|uniref:Uncharacterized protein n=1 Tax=Nitratireductor arenosus TaxID=2682096 RepID=A0A844QPV8_9HYPH|nr:hypothetical protein [Nitratireductor arenosus]MVB00079.1 hypothetical protein [Nitratireductor arenosus]